MEEQSNRKSVLRHTLETLGIASLGVWVSLGVYHVAKGSEFKEIYHKPADIIGEVQDFTGVNRDIVSILDDNGRFYEVKVLGKSPWLNNQYDEEAKKLLLGSLEEGDVLCFPSNNIVKSRDYEFYYRTGAESNISIGERSGEKLASRIKTGSECV